MISIIDYGMGNIRSVEKALQKTGAKVTVSSDPAILSKSSKIVVPGVGAFKDALHELEQRSLILPIIDFIKRGGLYLGICLGLQLLFEKSEENPESSGLAIIKGNVLKLPINKGLKIPHMGWNNIKFKKNNCPLLKDINNDSFMYFVHSYYVKPNDENIIALNTEYGVEFCSMIWKDNVYATQFHPEKSQQIGLKILKNFVSL